MARALASPRGVLVTIPLLVIAVGLGILLLGRDATRTASSDLARLQMTEQVESVQAEVARALDQAEPLMARTRVLAERLPPDPDLTDVLLHLHDLIVGRPGVSYISVSFPDGRYYHANATASGVIEVQESRFRDDGKTRVRWFTISGRKLVARRELINDYDPRQRPFYKIAVAARARAWTKPYTFALTFDTGITCTEPVFDTSGAVRAVLTVDFDVGALSRLVSRPTLDGARTIVYTGKGTILAYPSAGEKPPKHGDELLSYQALHDPALDALFAKSTASSVQLLDLGASSSGWLAAVAPIGGRRAGVNVPLDWYVATIVPKATLLGPTRTLERRSLIASGGALAIAVALALILAWNLVRMRRQVAQSREEARSANARARELGSYRLVAQLGSGGMGEVWRAEHRMLARTAAIKLIRPEAMRDPDSIAEVRERFRREAQTLASMKSHHTIALYDYGVTEHGVFYYVMELLDGIDLESLVVRYGAQPAARVIRILIQACASLAEAHDAGLLHRDIKPPNLFLCREADELDVVKLLDFGIVATPNDPELEAAKHTPEPEPEPEPEAPTSLAHSKLTRLGAMVGTPGFMAPEQILGMELDGRSDLYALGCCAWWLLVGHEVFTREQSHGKFLHQHIHDTPPSLRLAMQGWCPPELEHVIHACLAKTPEERPADARVLAARLRAIEIPDEHAWTEADAISWWATYEPPPVRLPPTGEVHVIMPGRTDQRPMAATSDEAIGPTIAQR